MIEKFEDAFRRLNINRGNQHVKEPAPHQPCLLLAVIEAIEQGTITKNAIHYEPRLLEHFDRYSDIVKSQKAGKKRKAHYPFVFLDAKDFWDLHLMPDRPKLDTWQARNKLGSSSHHKVEEDTDFVELDPELYVCLRDDPTARQRLRAALIDKWLSSHKEELWAAIRSARAWASDHKYGYDTINPNDPPAHGPCFHKAADHLCPPLDIGVLLAADAGIQLLKGDIASQENTTIALQTCRNRAGNRLHGRDSSHPQSQAG